LFLLIGILPLEEYKGEIAEGRVQRYNSRENNAKVKNQLEGTLQR
jgi:hypothetical protein